MQQVSSGSSIFGGRSAAAVFAIWFMGSSLALAQVPGREDPFGGTPPPAVPVPPVPSEPGMPPATPEAAPALPGGEAAPAAAPDQAPAPERGPAFESPTQPSAPLMTPAEEQIGLGRDLMEQGKNELAIQHFEEATKLAGDEIERANAFYQLGNALRRLNRYDEAIDAYSAGIANNPNDDEAFLRRGIAWFYKGEYGIAWDDFDEASILYRGTEPAAELWKGLAKAQQGKTLDAVNAYAKAILQNPRFSLAYTNRGLAYLQLDEPDKAVADFDQAIRNEPNNPVHYFRRGIAQGRLGQTKAAINSYNQALRLDPNYSDAITNRNALQGQAGPSSTRAKSPRA